MSALREILSELDMPEARRFRYSALGCKSFFDRAPTIITLVRFHLSLRSETEIP